MQITCFSCSMTFTKTSNPLTKPYPTTATTSIRIKQLTFPLSSTVTFKDILKPFESFCSQKAVKKSDTSRACCGETSPSMNRRALVRNRTFPSAIRFTVIFGGSHHSFFVRGPPSRKNLGEAFKQQSKASGTAHVLASLLKQCLLVNPKKLMPSFRRQLTPELYHYFKNKLVSSLS